MTADQTPPLSPEEIAKHDKVWGAGQWVMHFGCGIEDHGQPYAIHHMNYHESVTADQTPPLSPQAEKRMIWSGFFPPLTDERLAEIIDKHAERTARFPGGDSWQMSWLAAELRGERSTNQQLRAALKILADRWGRESRIPPVSPCYEACATDLRMALAAVSDYPLPELLRDGSVSDAGGGSDVAQ